MCLPFRQTGGLVVDGDHSLWVSRGLRPLLWQHSRGALLPGRQRWAAILIHPQTGYQSFKMCLCCCFVSLIIPVRTVSPVWVLGVVLHNESQLQQSHYWSCSLLTPNVVTVVTVTSLVVSWGIMIRVAITVTSLVISQGMIQTRTWLKRTLLWQNPACEFPG